MKDLSLKIVGGITIAAVVLGYVYFAKKSVEFLKDEQLYQDIKNFNKSLNNSSSPYIKR